MSDSEISPGTQESKPVLMPVGMLCELLPRIQRAVADMEKKRKFGRNHAAQLADCLSSHSRSKFPGCLCKVFDV